VSLTAGVSGKLPFANGGTNATSTPTAGGAAYGTGTAYAVTAAGSAGDCLKSGGAGAPTWGSCSSISAYSTIQDEATPLTQRTTLNFTGAGVSCVDNAGSSRTDCTIAGSSGPTMQTARLTADYTNATTTGTEVTGLQVSLAGAGTHLAEYYLLEQSSAVATGTANGINFTGSLTTLSCVRLYPSTGGTAATGVMDDVAATLSGNIYEHNAATAASTTAANLGPNTGVAAQNTNINVRITCTIVTAGAGDLELWHRSETAATTRVMTDSYVIVTTIP